MVSHRGETMSEVFDLIRTKRAVRQFRDEALPDEVVQQILDAARLSGSSKNTQPWTFIAIRDREALQALTAAGKYAAHLGRAALVVAIAQPLPSPSSTPDFDFGRAAQNMMLAAWAHGVGSVVTRLHFADKAAEVLGAPADQEIRWAIAFGYPAEAAEHPPRAEGRRGFDDVIRWDRW